MIDRTEMRFDGPMNQSEAHDDVQGPKYQQSQQRQRSVDSQKSFAPLFAFDKLRDEAPGLPGGTVEDARRSDAPRDTPRQDNSLKDVPENSCDHQDAEDADE